MLFTAIPINNGKHVNILYTYLGSQNTGDTNAVNHTNSTGKNIIIFLYFFLYIKYVIQPSISQNKNPTLNTILAIGKSLLFTNLFNLSNEPIFTIGLVSNL